MSQSRQQQAKVTSIFTSVRAPALVKQAPSSSTVTTRRMTLALCNSRCQSGFKPRLVQIFKRICFRFLNVGILFRCLCSWARQLTLTRFAWPKCKWVPGRTEMKIFTINLMRRNGYRTVYSPWIRNGTRINNSSFKWREKVADNLAVYMVYGRLTQRGIDFRRNLTSVNVRFWRIKTIPAL